jgi:hypothetical protein
MPAVEGKSITQRMMRTYEAPEGIKVLETKAVLGHVDPTPEYPHVNDLACSQIMIHTVC